jgi:hypothetical protein
LDNYVKKEPAFRFRFVLAVFSSLWPSFYRVQELSNSRLKARRLVLKTDDMLKY